MNRLHSILKNEVTGWNTWEISWLLCATLFIIILSIQTNDEIIGIIAAVTGVISVICSGKGKLSGFIFGIVNAILYAVIAYNTRYYGEMSLNILYYIPIQVYGLYSWNKNMNPETNEVYKRRMTNKERCILLLILVVTTVFFGLILTSLHGNNPFIDALSSLLSVVTMYIAVKRFMEQWILWIVANSVKLILWIIPLMQGAGNTAIMLMSLIYLINSFIMFFKWRNEVNKNNIK
ncbi:nicotinamide riboside transporter PnuC [Methanosphaera sp.]|uniref:nicotinamide riboside transporter PnuC n=1 Tax=Methanosphaera sp. TaxID=2666342 RepID=UPI003D90F916